MNASPSSRTVGRRVLADEPELLRELETSLLEAMSRHGYSETSAFAVRLAVQEALANAFKHGNRGERGRNAIVDYAVGDDDISIEVQDQGDGFDWASVPDPTADENIAIPAGRGIMLMRAYMTSVEFIAPGNRVRMIYRKP